jgi:hypothetical protein
MTTPAELPCLLDLNDVDLRLSRGTEILAHAPGFATWTGTKLELGDAAHAAAWRHPRHTHHRHWQVLDTSPLKHLGKRVRHAGDLAYLQLEALRRQAGNPQRVILLHPGHWQRAQLGLLLGITEAAGFAVAGIVEHGVAVGASLPPGTYHFVEACLEQTLVTELRVDATGANRGAQRAVTESGFLALEQAVIEVIVAAFLQESRFDPLHDGGTEQLLHDQLGEWLALLARRDEISLVITHRGVRHLASLQRAAVIRALAPHRAALMRACGEGTVLLDDRLGRFPGLLDGWHGAALLPMGSAQRGILGSPDLHQLTTAGLISRSQLAAIDGARLLPVQLPVRTSAPTACATHLLAGTRAQGLASGPWYLDAHCALHRVRSAETVAAVFGDADGARVESPDGSPLRVNGAALAGSRRLIPGDRLEVLGCDRVLLAIAVTDGDAA